MKGHMQDGQFHPHTEYKKGTRKSRDQQVKTQGVRMKKTNVSSIKAGGKCFCGRTSVKGGLCPSCRDNGVFFEKLKIEQAQRNPKNIGAMERKARTISMIKFSNKEEKTTLDDLGKYQIPSDKIRVTNKAKGFDEEQFETLTSFKNKDDAKLFVKTYNQIEENILGIKTPMVIKRFVQNGVAYDVYQARWRTMKNGELVEVDVGDEPMFPDNPDHLMIPTDKWREFKNVVNEIIPKRTFT